MDLGLCLEMLWDNLPFEERLERAARAGFRHVEMWFVDGTYQGSPTGLRRLASDLGVTVTNSVVGAPDGELGGGLTDPGKRSQWLDRARMTLDFNAEAGIGAAIVCTGNVVPGQSDGDTRSSVLDGLAATAELAEEAGVTLLLEPLNTTRDHPGYWLSSSGEAAELVRHVDSPRLRLLFDCYHTQIMEGNLWERIEAHLDVIGHFHSAGVPGRFEPTDGEVNYPYILRRLEAAGYEGIFGLEYRPSFDADASVCRTREAFVRALS